MLCIQKPLTFDVDVETIAFHPNHATIAVGLITGEIAWYDYHVQKFCIFKKTKKVNKHPIRNFKYTNDGKLLLVVTEDSKLKQIDTKSYKIISKTMRAHDVPISCIFVIDEHLVATGDDDGVIKIWDFRNNKALKDFQVCDDFISDFAVDKKTGTLLATSGEGTLTAFKYKNKTISVQSELFDAELLCVDFMKNNEKAVCASGDGALYLFNNGEWGNMSDRFPGHPSAIECMVPISDSVLCTGCSDGELRLVNIIPNRFIGKIEHNFKLPVHSMCMDATQKIMAAASYDQSVELFDMSQVQNVYIDASKKAKKLDCNKNALNFFDDLKESDEVDDTSDSDVCCNDDYTSDESECKISAKRKRLN